MAYDVYYPSIRLRASLAADCSASFLLWPEPVPTGWSLSSTWAKLAAFYSQARESGNVPVDYTPVRFVKKPSGGRPGMVIYSTCRTVYVTPDPALVKQLQIR